MKDTVEGLFSLLPASGAGEFFSRLGRRSSRRAGSALPGRRCRGKMERPAGRTSCGAKRPPLGPAVEADDQGDEQPTTLVVNFLQFVGSGWHNTGDAMLANTAAAMAREQRRRTCNRPNLVG